MGRTTCWRDEPLVDSQGGVSTVLGSGLSFRERMGTEIDAMWPWFSRYVGGTRSNVGTTFPSDRARPSLSAEAAIALLQREPHTLSRSRPGGEALPQLAVGDSWGSARDRTGDPAQRTSARSRRLVC